MPTRTRPHRSLLALFAVVALVATGAPASAGSPSGTAVLRAPDRDADASTPSPWVEPPATAIVPEVVTDPLPADTAIPARSLGPDDAPDTPWTRRATPDVPDPKPRVEARGSSGATASGSIRGRNRMWIPALGVNRSVSYFSCSSNAYPGDRVYRWGCAGGNNIYLFGHAHSVFKPLHDAYVRGRLTKGMKVHYADAKGRVSTYAVRWWKVTTPDRGEFAYAGQSRPSLTLQTCVGSKSQYRLVVRLVKVG